MRRYFFALCCLLAAYVHAEFVQLDLTGQHMPVSEAPAHFDEWFGTGDSEFVLFFDDVDQLGMRDMDYQQYVNGVKVENCALYVHSKDGWVTLINGDIVRREKLNPERGQISRQQARKRVLASDSAKTEETIIHVATADGEKVYNVYKITTDNEIHYVDKETGRVVRVLPRVYSAVACTATTFYEGEKKISCEKVDGNYVLRNNTKKIRTNYAVMSNLGAAYPSSYYDFKCSTTNWNRSYLTSVTITAVHGDWWSGLISDNYPDLYIRIKDASSDTYYYTSDYKEDCGEDVSFPVTFHLSKMIPVPTNGLIIEVYDQDLLGDTKGISVSLSSTSVATYTFGKSTSAVQGSLTLTNSHPAFDLHWGLEKTYDFYSSTFGLSGFDGKNTLLRAFVHYTGGADNIVAERNYTSWKFWLNSDHYTNAYAAGEEGDASTAHMFFGLGNEICNPMTDINTVTHEFTHLVTRYRPKGNLVYSGESGAINEGYSDAMAMACEDYLYGEVDWLYGNGIDYKAGGKTYSYLRNVKNPKMAGPEGLKPNTYQGLNWYDPTNTAVDNGGVHMNNSIFTFWFYLLSEGGTGTNDKACSYSVKGIGIKKARDIAWRMHRTYLPPQASFSQARTYAIQSAKDLYPGDTTIECAVTNAWYAVGVGGKYTPTVTDYVIVARKNAQSEWFYLTSTADIENRFMAIGTNQTSSANISTMYLANSYYWNIEGTGSSRYLKSKDKGQYVAWTSGNTAELATTGNLLDYTTGTTADYHCFSLTDYSSKPYKTRYLALDATDLMENFAFYTDQQSDLLVIQKGSVITTDMEQVIGDNPQSVKVIRDGQIYVLKDGCIYDMLGKQVR